MSINRQRAFTLVEIAIVLGIIALIVGGVVVGQSLVRSAQLRALVSDSQIYIDAIMQFKKKYRQFPGDFSNAESLWGTGTACGAPGCMPRKETFDGNGDNCVYSGVSYAGGDTNEAYLLWQHLANAGMIPGQYSGTYYDAGDGYDMGIGVNVPKTAIGGATTVFWNPCNGEAGEWGATLPVNALQITGIAIYQLNTLPYPILLPEEALGIDQKMDDGRPAYGMVTAPPPTFNAPIVDHSNCVTTGVASTSEYDTSKSGAYCALRLRAPD